MQSQRLDAVADIMMGQAPEGESYNLDGQGLPLIAGAGDFGELYPAPKKFTTAPGKTCQSGDVILGIRATIGEKVLADGTYCLGRGVAGLRVRPGLNERYLWHWMTHVTPTLAAKAKGATFKQVNREDIGELPITLPPIPEQRRIATILDKADELRAKRRVALAKLDTLTQSIFLDMFGDPDAHRWPMVTVADLADHTQAGIRTGPFGSQLLHSEFTDNGIAVLGIDNVVENDFRWGQRRHISEEKYRQLARYTVHAGDVLITIMGTLGRCAIVPDNIPTAINTKHLCCISLDRSKCLPVFLHAYFLRHPIAQRHLSQKAKGAIMEGLNMGIIKEMPIPLVPMELQETFATRLKEVSNLRMSEQRSAMECDALFGSLQHRAFRGDL